MYFYSILFGDIRYAYMAMMMLQSLEKVPFQKHILLVSSDIFKKIEKMHYFHSEKYIIIEIPPPADIYDAMRYKYKLNDYVDCSGATFMYIDCDMMCVRPFSQVLPADCFKLFPEGALLEDNYSGIAPFMEVPSPGAPGFTAGFFMFNYGPNVQRTFDAILESMETNMGFYTLDQPHFNKIIYSGTANVQLLDDGFISFNMHNNTDTCSFVNLAGHPGNGELHFSKMFDLFMSGFQQIMAASKIEDTKSPPLP